ncbi:MAG: potassium-transporting ATPase subunit KdpC [Terriglobales bacterium]|jgi:K+-transporting ATPase ATPase C chain
MKKHLITSLLMALVTTLLLGILYPLTITALAQLFFRDKANGQLIVRNGQLVGSGIIGQPFTGPGYFHSRPSAAGDAGYDASASGGSNLGPTNQKLIDRIRADAQRVQSENPGLPVPVDLVTTSASGLDPDISLAAAEFQIPRVALERKMPEALVKALVDRYRQSSVLGLLGEPRVRVLELNLALNASR